jgi:alkylation response protein AidB-like acyl-CoA dehydrogenase
MSAAGDHPFVEAVARYAEEERRPAALATDAAEVPRAAIDRLRALGALNHLAPAAYGGAGLDLDAVPVADEDVLAVQSFDERRRADAVLRELETEPHDAAREVAAAWSPLIAQFRATAYGLTDEAADDTAQLHARSAQFCLVQGQSAAARDAHLARLAADVPNRPTIQESLSLQ